MKVSHLYTYCKESLTFGAEATCWTDHILTLTPTVTETAIQPHQGILHLQMWAGADWKVIKTLYTQNPSIQQEKVVLFNNSFVS